jgi:cell division protein FtsN
MDKKKTKTSKKASPKTKYLLQMTSKGVVLSLCLIVLISGWMFVLGVLVGRGTAPINFDIEVLQKELKALKESIIRQQEEKERVEVPSFKEEKELDFYEALKGPQTDEKLIFKKQEASKTGGSYAEQKTQAEAASKNQLTSMKKLTKTGSMPSVKGAFYVQVASTKNVAAADELVIKLNRKGYQAYKVKVEIPDKGTWYRVCAGGFNSQTQAKTARGKIATLGYKGIVKKN